MSIYFHFTFKIFRAITCAQVDLKNNVLYLYLPSSRHSSGSIFSKRWLLTLRYPIA